MDELLPVLVAHVEDADVVDLLRAVAQGHRVALLHLAEAPMDTSRHVLEVNAPGLDEPVLFLAEPQGPPDEDGFPLRLHPFGAPVPAPADDEPTIQLPPARARSTLKKRPSLTAQHEADLRRSYPPPQEVPAAQQVGLVLAGGKYILEEPLGSGSFGSVFRARHRELQKTLAIKILHPRFQCDPSFCQRFYGEALAASRLDHANIVRVFDYGQEPSGLLFIVMEFLSGQTLRHALEQSGTMPLERIVDVMQQVCAGLSHAHEHSLVHRDIKPDNIMLISGHDDEGRPKVTAKVCDFGIARWSFDPAGPMPSGPAEESHIAGTPAYMAPEQCRGTEIDLRADIYACGIVLYELATGRPPFAENDAMKVVRQQVREQPPPPSRFAPGIDRRLETIIMKALEKDPSLRHQSMRELRSELGELRPEPVVSARAAKILARLEQGMRNMAAQSPSPMLRQAARVSEPPRAAESAPPPAPASAPSADGAPERSEGAVAAPTTRGGATRIDEIPLEVVAEEALVAPPERSEAAAAEIVAAGARGAHALCNARMKVRTDAAARPRFIALVHHIGVPAGPAVRATLELALAADPAALDTSLVEDLLRALSGTPDEASGKMVAELVKSELPGVARVAVTTLAHLWGARARPLLIGVLDKAPDGVRIASLASLRATGGFDEHVIRRLDRILARVYPSGEELRAAAALAITEGTPATRNIAIEALLRTLSVPKGGLFSKLIGGGAQEDSPLVLVAAAKALLSMRVSQAHAAIFERAQKSPEPLRSRLLEMLQK